MVEQFGAGQVSGRGDASAACPVCAGPLDAGFNLGSLDLGSLSVGALDNGELLSPATVRRIACDARIIPAVLGGDGAILDLGRGRRLWTHAVRAAIILRDGGCAFPGCDRPPQWCEVHHRVSWLLGGSTDLETGVLLCGAHHRLIHHSGWEILLGTDGRPDFIPPAHIDPLRKPRRNTFHRRP
jgi:hypothetical protein